MEENRYDVIIIGGGPAGLSAAIYTSRANLKTLLLAGETPGGQLIWTTEVENYPGFSAGIQGPQLVEEMRKQAEKFGTVGVNRNVEKVDFSGGEKKVWAGGKEYVGRVVVVTTGAKARMLGIGEEKLLGRGVSTCATCDAAFFKGKKTFVVGGGDVAMEDALALSKFAQEVTIIHRKGEFRASKIMQKRVLEEKKIPVMWNSEVIEVKEDGKLKAIVVRDVVSGETKELEADGLFLAIGHLPDTEFLKGHLEMDDHEYLITRMTAENVKMREEMRNGYPTMTSVEGVFGAGDLVDFRYRQAATASAMGVMAALDAEKYLTGNVSSW